MTYLLGIDVGGTSVRVAIAPSNNLRSMQKLRQDTAKTAPDSISLQIIDMIMTLVNRLKLNIEDVKVISIATAGPIDPEKGEVFNNANLGFKTIPLKIPIAQKFPGIPVYIINDCRSAVLGIHCFEALPEEKDNMGYVTISTGIGGGFIVNGHLVLGKEGNASEVGHGTIAPKSGVRCNCGAEGCWEAFSSGTAITNHTIKALELNPNEGTILRNLIHDDIAQISAKVVYLAARMGDKLAQGVVDQANFYNALGLGLINNYYDPKVIYLGGSMLKDEQQILLPLQELFEKTPIKFTINHPPLLKKTTLGDEVGLLGALALGKYKLENNPVISTFK